MYLQKMQADCATNKQGACLGHTSEYIILPYIGTAK
jgi:hypothetical protein